MKPILIFTDGAARRNPGPGGWGAIVVMGDTVTELGGADAHTTNNRMELSGVIEALHFVREFSRRNLSTKSAEESPQKAPITLHTDSSYVLNGATKWIHGWKNTGWKTKAKEEVLNRDLWETLAPLLTHFRIEWILLKGHAGIPANERCDVIATTFADGKKINLFHGARADYDVEIEVSQSRKTESGQKKSKSKAKPYAYISAIEGKVMIHKTWPDCEARVKGKSNARFKKVFSPDEQRDLIKAWSMSRGTDS